MTTPVLFVKPGCPWCDEAEDYLDRHGIAYIARDVISDEAAYAEMKSLSGQSKAPTMEWGGEVLADFGEDELDAFLRERGIVR